MLRSSRGRDWFSGHTGDARSLFDALKAAAKNPTQAALGTLNRTLNAFVSDRKASRRWTTGRHTGQPDRQRVRTWPSWPSTLAGVASVAPLAAALQQVLHQLAPATNQVPDAGGVRPARRGREAA